MLSISPKAKLLKVDWGKNPKDYQAAPIKITFWYEIPDYAIIGNDEMALVPLTMHGLYDQVRSYLRIDTDIPERQYGFKDGCSRLVELDETIQLPQGYRLVQPSKITGRARQPILKAISGKKTIKSIYTKNWP